MTDRADLRVSIQRKTDGGLTVEADQDYYLDNAELELLPLWYAFEPERFAKGRQSAVTDSSGILLLPVSWLENLRLEDSDELRYENITVNQKRYSTGYYREGYDIASGKSKVQMMKAGNALASTTIYFYDTERTLMGATATDEPLYPIEFRDLIAYKGAQLYFEDQGSSFDDMAEKRRVRFDRRLATAREMYERQETSPQFAQTMDPDANQRENRLAGSLGYY